jgi:O-acetyl-ADP-ribose deacetylase (regulator of RNase III)
VRGNLLEEPVDAIVNAANGHLAHGGGVAGVIARAAGPALVEESERIVKRQGPLPTGAAVVTTAGRLPFKGVIHAVGPRYLRAARASPLSNVRLCLRDQPVIDAVLKEMKP